jgi:hypothetical protein
MADAAPAPAPAAKKAAKAKKPADHPPFNKIVVEAIAQLKEVRSAGLSMRNNGARPRAPASLPAGSLSW